MTRITVAPALGVQLELPLLMHLVLAAVNSSLGDRLPPGVHCWQSRCSPRVLSGYVDSPLTPVLVVRPKATGSPSALSFPISSCGALPSRLCHHVGCRAAAAACLPAHSGCLLSLPSRRQCVGGTGRLVMDARRVCRPLPTVSTAAGRPKRPPPLPSRRWRHPPPGSCVHPSHGGG